MTVCFEVLDEDGSGSLTREELTKVLAHHHQSKVNKKKKRTRPLDFIPSDDNLLGTKKRQETEDGFLGYGDRYSFAMDPEAFEFAEGVANLFEVLDANHDDEVSLQEFLDGIRRQPHLLEVFFKCEAGQEDGSPPTSAGAPAAAPPITSAAIVPPCSYPSSVGVGVVTPGPPTPTFVSTTPASNLTQIQATVAPTGMRRRRKS